MFKASNGRRRYRQAEPLAAVATAGQLVAGHGVAAGERYDEVVIDGAGPAPDSDVPVPLGTVTLVFTHCVEVRSPARPKAVGDDGMIAAVAEDAFSLVEPSGTALGGGARPVNA